MGSGVTSSLSRRLNSSAQSLCSVALGLFLLCVLAVNPVDASTHPNLVLTESGVAQIRSNLGRVPLFDHSLAEVKEEIDREISAGIDTPVPRDFSGGYTHERHKKNYVIAQQAAALYQILEDETYAVFVRDMLFQYEQM